MNDTQKQKRKYGNYCLRSANGEKKRKCHTGKCVDKVNKTPGVPSKRCRKGTRKCSDQRCYPFTKKSKNPISKVPFKIIKYKPETLSFNSSNTSSGYGVKIQPIIDEEEQQEQQEQPQPKSKISNRKKSKSSRNKKNYTSHGKYGNKKNPFTIQQEEEFSPIQSKQFSSLNLPVINNTNTKRSKRKRKSSKNSKSNIVYKRVSPPPSVQKSPLYAETVNSSSSQKITPNNEPILLLEDGNKKEKSPIMDVEEEPEEPEEPEEAEEEEPEEPEEEDLQPIEELSKSPIENVEEERENSEEKEETPIMEVEEENSEQQEENPEEQEENPEEQEENPEEQEENPEEQEQNLQPIEELSQSSPTPQPSSSPAKKSSDISVGSIKSEGSSGGKKHSKKYYKKKSKKHHKKKYNKKSKKHHKKNSRKRSKK
jgi:hypothetical protein